MDEQYKNMLDLMRRPAFCVEDSVICHINPAAQQSMLSCGSSVLPLIVNGQKEFESFQDGSLYLTLQLGQQKLGAEVVRLDHSLLFLLEEPETATELRSLALAAKELREPLAGILSAASGNTPAMNRRLFQLMRMVSNMSDVYRYSQQEAGRMELVQIVSFFDEILERAASLLQQAGILLEYISVPDTIFTLADPELLERAVYNLLSNAAKYSSSGDTVQVHLSRSGDRIHLSVIDHGPGIHNSIKGSLYSRFQRDPALEDPRYGIGLGMVLIRSAAAAHGGTVLVDQKDGQGNRITLTLQIQQPKQTTLRSPAMRIDYAGEWDHGLLELADCLPIELYQDI